MADKNRDSAIKRIQALHAKTTANGATEAEALAAAAKAGELMDRYGLSMSDVQIKETVCERRQASSKPHDVDRVAPAVGRFCGCRMWFKNGRIQYFGMPHDVEVAFYLTDLLRNAIDGEWRRFLRSPERPLNVKPYRLKVSFMVGMTKRLIERLDEMRIAREAEAKTSSGTALVVVKNAVVTEQFAKLGLALKTSRNRGTRVDLNSLAAGKRAGDRVNISRGVTAAAKAGSRKQEASNEDLDRAGPPQKRTQTILDRENEASVLYTGYCR